MADYFELLVEDLLEDPDEPILINLGNAIAEISKIAKNNPRAKWRGVPKKYDMSRHVFTLIRPIINEILQSIHESWTITNRLPWFTMTGGTKDMQMTASYLYEFIYPLAEDVYKDAANYLHLFLVKAVKEFQPKSKLRPAKEVEFCIYCYREVYGNAKEKFAKNTCHIHSDEHRGHGKYHAERFQEMSFYFTRNKRKQSIKTYQIYLLKMLGVPEYTNQDIVEWLKVALHNMDACYLPQTPNYASFLAKQKGVHDNQKPWPKILNATMLRYAAYKLAKTMQPRIEVANRLNEIWEGESCNIKKMAFKYGVSRQVLHRQVRKWGEVIKDFREQGLDDETIKLVLNLKSIPPSFKK